MFSGVILPAENQGFNKKKHKNLRLNQNISDYFLKGFKFIEFSSCLEAQRKIHEGEDFQREDNSGKTGI